MPVTQTDPGMRVTAAWPCLSSWEEEEEVAAASNKLKVLCSYISTMETVVHPVKLAH